MSPIVAHRLLPGLYADSLVLMQLQRALEARPGIEAAAAVMATAANRELVVEQGLWPPAGVTARPDDLLVAVRAVDPAAAEAALAEVEALLAARRDDRGAGEHRPRSLAAGLAALPAARWVLVSVPGRWATGVAREALAAGRNVFLYSDNVPLAEEVALKEEAARRGLLVMGPDCGSASVAGIGLGFANRVRRGTIGLVAASGTGLQAVACGIDARGGGISHALGTGGRDLSAEVAGASARAALDLLARDEATRVVVLVSKPPDGTVAARLLAIARASEKPTVVWFLGAAPPARRMRNLWFAVGSDEAAELAVGLARSVAPGGGADGPATGAGARDAGPAPDGSAPAPGFLRGLFSGGTLAAEAAVGLLPFLAPLASNLTLPGAQRLGAPGEPFAGHTIVDLGADEYTAGRPHPMLEPSLVAERLRAAGADPATALVLFDVVLGDGAHPDPAGELAPAVAAALAAARGAGRRLEAVAVLVGTDADPQDRAAQAERLTAAGARVTGGVAEALRYAVSALPSPPEAVAAPVSLAVLAEPFAAVNVGLPSFAASLAAQGAEVVHVDWRPPAGGDERLARILERSRGRR